VLSKFVLTMKRAETEILSGLKDKRKTIKCLIWDLDDTMWDGILVEDEIVNLRPQVLDIIQTLDGRGILQSIASRNDHHKAVERLREFGLFEYFLYPQINWNSKASSVKKIAESLNIGLDAIAFIDDQAYERAEVRHSFPDVLCIDAADLRSLPELPEMNPRFVTEDSKARRSMYVSDITRNKVEEEFVGSKEEFLASLGMIFTVSSAKEDDLKRAEELTIRTNQLNTTGYTYSFDELNRFRQSGRHKLLISSLEDKFGTYGKIGLALIECEREIWTIKLLLMSCRVISRGVGNVLLSHILKQAKERQVTLRAEFLSNDRNRLMHITYKFGGFREYMKDGDFVIFEHDLSRIPVVPDYIEVRASD
jgi:FkbH-like protein